MRARTAVVSLIALLLAVPLALAAPSAASPDRPPIDPLTLNPPLEHGDPVCTWRGDLIVCESTVPQPYDLGTFDTGIACAGADLLQTVNWTLEKGIATYDASKDIVRLEYIDSYTGSFSNPGTGLSGAWRQQDRTEYVFTTPGDTETGTATMTARQQVHSPTGQVVLTDAGREVFSLPDYTRLRSMGHHPLDDFVYAGSTAGLARLCDALS